MDHEYTIEKQDSSIIKEKIIKTNDLLLLYNEKHEKLGRATQAFKHLKSNYENAVQEAKKLKFDNERLTDTVQRLKPKNEQIERELTELKLDYAKVEERYHQTLIESQLISNELEQKVKQCTCEQNLLTLSPSRKKTAHDKVRELKQICSDLKDAEHQLQIQNNNLTRKNNRLKEKLLNNANSSNLKKELAEVKEKLQEAESSLKDQSSLQETIYSLKHNHKNEVDALKTEISRLSLDSEKLKLVTKECSALEEKANQLEMKKNNKCDFSSQTEQVFQEESSEIPDALKMETSKEESDKTTEMDDDVLLDLDSSLSFIFQEMILPATMMSPFSRSSHSAESPTSPLLDCFEPIAPLPQIFLEEKLILQKPVPNIIVTPPTPNVLVNGSLSVQFPMLTDLPVNKESEEPLQINQNPNKNTEEIEKNLILDKNIENNNCTASTIEKPNNDFANTAYCVPSTANSVNKTFLPSKSASNAAETTEIVTHFDPNNVEEKSLPLDSLFDSVKVHTTTTLNDATEVGTIVPKDDTLEFEHQDQKLNQNKDSKVSALAQVHSALESVDLDVRRCLTSNPATETASHDYSMAQENSETNLDFPAVRSELTPSENDIDLFQTPLNKVNEVQKPQPRRRKFWFPYSMSPIVKSKPKNTRKYSNRSRAKGDTILDALKTLQHNNINFTISNELIPLTHNYSCCPVLSPPKPEIRYISRPNSKNTFSGTMECWNKKCTEKNSLMMLRKTSQHEEPELLGFFSVKAEVVTPSLSRMTVTEKHKDTEFKDLVEQLLNGLKEFSSTKRKKASENKRKKVLKPRNRASEFHSETESELERLFRSSADVLGRNRKLFTAAREQNFIESNGDSESDVMADSGLVTATPKNDTNSLSCCSTNNEEISSPISRIMQKNEGSSSNETKGISDFTNFNFSSTPTPKLNSDILECSPTFFKVPKTLASPGQRNKNSLNSIQDTNEDSIDSYKTPFCPVMISPLALSTKGSPAKSSPDTLGPFFNDKATIHSDLVNDLNKRARDCTTDQISSSICQKITFDGGRPSFTENKPEENTFSPMDFSIKTYDLNYTLNDINLSQLEVSSVLLNEQEDTDGIHANNLKEEVPVKSPRTMASKRKLRVLKTVDVSEGPSETKIGRQNIEHDVGKNVQQVESKCSMNLRSKGHLTCRNTEEDKNVLGRKLRSARSKREDNINTCNVTNIRKRSKPLFLTDDEIEECGTIKTPIKIDSPTLEEPLKSSDDNPDKLLFSVANSASLKTNFDQFKLKYTAKKRSIARRKSRRIDSDKSQKIVSKEFISESDSDGIDTPKPLDFDRYKSEVIAESNKGKETVEQSFGKNLQKITSEIQQMLRDLPGDSETDKCQTTTNIDKDNMHRDLFGELSDNDDCDIIGKVSLKTSNTKRPLKRGQNLKCKMLKQMKGMVYAYGNKLNYSVEKSEVLTTNNKSVGVKVEKNDVKVNIVQDILITNGKTVNLMSKNSQDIAKDINSCPKVVNKTLQTYSRKRLNGEKKRSTAKTPADILSQVMEGMKRTKPILMQNKPNCSNNFMGGNCGSLSISNSQESIRKIEHKKKEELIQEETDLFGDDRPKSPDVLEVPDRLPRLIPLEKPTVMVQSKVVYLMDRLMVFSNEQRMLDDVIKEFAFQDIDYMARIIVDKLCHDIYDKADIIFPPSPPMTGTQRVLLGFLNKLNRSTHPGILDKFLLAAEKELFNNSTCNLHILQPVARLYTAICKMRKDMNRMRRFVCESFYFTGDFAVPILFTVLTMWPDTLPLESQMSKYPLAKIIVQLCNLKCCNEPGYNLMPLRDLLHKYFGYPTERWSCEEVFEEILVEYIRNPSIRLSDFSLLLFLKHKPANWVSHKIKTNLRPLYQLVPESNPNLKATLLILLGNICFSFRHYEKVEWSIICEMTKWFKGLQGTETHPVVLRSLLLASARLPKKPVKKKVRNIAQQKAISDSPEALSTKNIVNKHPRLSECDEKEEKDKKSEDKLGDSSKEYLEVIEACDTVNSDVHKSCSDRELDSVNIRTNCDVNDGLSSETSDIEF